MVVDSNGVYVVGFEANKEDFDRFEVEFEEMIQASSVSLYKKLFSFGTVF